MRTSEFYDWVTSGGGAVIEELLELLEENGNRYCVIGGQAVNHYAEPLVSLVLDLMVATGQLEAVEALLAERFSARRFPHSLNVTPPAATCGYGRTPATRTSWTAPSGATCWASPCP